MKIKDGFILRSVAGETVALPTQGVTDLDMMISLNGTARFLWEKMTEETDFEALVAAMLEEYDVDEETARKSIGAFIEKLKEHDFLV